MEEEKSKKRPLDLDSKWDVILGRDDQEPPPLTIVKNTPLPSQREEFAFKTDKQLAEQIEKYKIHAVTHSLKLPDKGEKLRAILKTLEEELELRKHRRIAQMDHAECEKPTLSTGSTICSASDGSGKKDSLSQVNSQSQFASIFNRKMEENTDCRVVNAFDKELTTLAHRSHQYVQSNGGLSQKQTQNSQSSSRQLPFQCASSLSLNGDKPGHSNGDQKGRGSSTHIFRHKGESFSSNSSKKKNACHVLPSRGSRLRKDPAVVVLDEDEPQLVETKEQMHALDKCMKDTKIYYPSRDDPESVEIAYKDMDCLSREAFLTSPILNFYIRYLRLQASPANKATCDYHFFNTFFYKKLEQAISYKGSDKESFFIKFRRWWKGVNIFEKAYILIPIHDDLHWSLVIICFPDQEDESGPIILHLDSLRFHCSSTVFLNVRSYLKEEWSYMNQEKVSIDFPIPKRIWKHLDRRIDEKIIEVPQQKNEYDCGLFVLFFMERFIEEAPERLRKKDLAMFGKRWFRPEEASELRKKIRGLLMDEFQKAFDRG